MLIDAMFPDASPLPAPDPGIGRSNLPPLCMSEMEDAIHGMEAHKAPGHDGVTAEMLQHSVAGLGIFRRRLFNLFAMAVMHGNFPTPWRRARITVIPKAGPREMGLPKSYRPILLLCTAAKAVDKIMTARIHSLASLGLLSGHHYGSQPNISATHAIATLLEKGRNCLQARKVVVTTTIDVGGAFNNIDHERLCAKISKRGHPKLARWVASWLQHRCFSVLFEGTESTQRYLGHRGVPQGSPISPILWTIYLDSFFWHQPPDPALHLQGAYVDNIFALTVGLLRRVAIRAMQNWLDSLAAWCEPMGLTLDKPTFVVHDGHITPTESVALQLRLPSG